MSEMRHTPMFIQRLGPQTATFRYRSQIPAKQLGGSVNGGEASVLIFSKPTPDDLELAKQHKGDLGIIVDFCDDHFRTHTMGKIYAEMAHLADRIVVPTENMAGRITKYTGLTAHAIIPDPYEEELCPPHADGNRFVWFGHSTNLKEIRPWLPEMQNRDFTMVTLDPRQTLNTEFIPWTQQTQTTELRKANIACLPTRKGVEYKSPNRIVNALRAGCFPVCGGSIPSYREFRKFAWVGNFATGIRWAEHCRAELNDLVSEGQKYIEKFSPENVGNLWREVIESL